MTAPSSHSQGGVVPDSVNGFTKVESDDDDLHGWLRAAGAFLAAAVWGGQWVRGHIFIWGGKNFG